MKRLYFAFLRWKYLPAFLLSLLSLTALFSGVSPQKCTLCILFPLLLLAERLDRGGGGVPWMTQVLLLAGCLCAGVFFFAFSRGVWLLFSLCPSLLVLLVRLLRPYSPGVRRRQEMRMSHLLYLPAYVLLYLLCLILPVLQFFASAPAAFLLCLPILLLQPWLSLCSRRGSILFLSRPYLLRQESVLVKSYKGEYLNAIKGSEGGEVLMRRLESYFERERPWLNPDLKVSAVARALYTNRLYLSRVIRFYKNLNFKQYVNEYRIRHALSCFRASRGTMTVAQMAKCSGFINTTTFGLAFHMIMHQSPGEWCRNNFARCRDGR